MNDKEKIKLTEERLEGFFQAKKEGLIRMIEAETMHCDEIEKAERLVFGDWDAAKMFIKDVKKNFCTVGFSHDMLIKDVRALQRHILDNGGSND